MIHVQDRAASDDAAAAAANAIPAKAPAKSSAKTKRGNRRAKIKTLPVSEQMANLFCANFARNLPTTKQDLWMEGFSAEQIADHLPAARKLANSRIGCSI